MSGVEAVGLVLGVLPLLISVLEHYEDVLRPFRRYIQFTSKAQRFCDELETERAIFHAECQLLLEVVAEREGAMKMLDDFNHSLWRDAVLGEKLRQEFGSLGYPCTSTISRINDKLIELDSKSKELVPNLSHTTTVRSKISHVLFSEKTDYSQGEQKRMDTHSKEKA
jgi:hypothetical protein